MSSPYRFVAVFTMLLGGLLAYGGAQGHCDSLDGPVVRDARIALEKGDPFQVLKWVDKEHEDEIREAFKQTMAVRAKGSDARALADRYFFETLVRIHRAGEGEAFTGLISASSVDPGIAAADEALRTGSAKELATRLSNAVSAGINERFARAFERRKSAGSSIEAGREYVKAYVDYIHFAEGMNQLTTHGAPHTHRDAEPHLSE